MKPGRGARRFQAALLVLLPGGTGAAAPPGGGLLPSPETVVEVVSTLLVVLAVPILLLLVLWLAAERIAGLLAQLVVRLMGEKDAVVSRVRTGREGMVGQVGEARTALAPGGQVFVRGELWNAVAPDGPVSAQQRVEVIDIDGLTLTVRPHREPDESAGPPVSP